MYLTSAPGSIDRNIAGGSEMRSPRWALFDDAWYARRYEVPAPRQSYELIGRHLQCAPNRLFDEQWYLARYPDIRDLVQRRSFQSGFEHYRETGYKDRSPNSLFDEAFYREQYASLFRPGGLIERRGYFNGFDHYLDQGAAEGKRPSRYFDEQVWAEFREQGGGEGGLSALEQFIAAREHEPQGSLCRTSWYFDPGWYVERYPEVMDGIRDGICSTPLAHYLSNHAPSLFDPNPHFSEGEYQATYPDVAAAVAFGQYRNGYSHFLQAGIIERRRPNSAIDLRHYADPKVVVEIDGGLYPDVFAHYVASQIDQTGARILREPRASEQQAKRLFALNARITSSAALRNGLDFSLQDRSTADVSVILVLHNQFSFTMAALSSLLAQACTIDLILVDSGSTDESRHIEQFVKGAKIIRLAHNVGFIAGCNAGLAAAKSELVLYMNNDVVLAAGCLRAAITRIHSRPDAGAVGGRIIRTHGRLQEAGCILWRDGSTIGYLRDQAADIPEANFVREVDFCSGAFLLVHSRLARQLEGFSTAFSPAYYEDVDFCTRLRQAGTVILYDPDVLLHHYEYGSSNADHASGRITAARHVFNQRHTGFLRFQYNYRGTDYVRARDSCRSKPRILFIEDRIPWRRLGSGYVRSNDLVRVADGLGYAVTVFPMQPEPDGPVFTRRDFPDTVELLHDRSSLSFASFLVERAGMYDVIWIGRTHNLTQLLPTLAAASGSIPDFGIVLDTEAIAAPRILAKQSVSGDPAPQDTAELVHRLERELSGVGFAQHLVAVSETDASLIRFAGHDAVSVLGHLVTPRPKQAGLADRAGLLFVGALHSTDSPNYDSLLWFLTEIFPRVAAALGAAATLTIAGFAAPGLDVSPFLGHARVRYLGEVDDLAALYSAHRVFVAPTRFAAGIPYKIHEAVSHGLPVVASSALCVQLGWDDEEEILDGGQGDATMFARQVTRLYSDAGLWHRLRNRSLLTIERENGEAAFREKLAVILESARSCREAESDRTGSAEVT